MSELKSKYHSIDYGTCNHGKGNVSGTICSQKKLCTFRRGKTVPHVWSHEAAKLQTAFTAHGLRLFSELTENTFYDSV